MRKSMCFEEAHGAPVILTRFYLRTASQLRMAATAISVFAAFWSWETRFPQGNKKFTKAALGAWMSAVTGLLLAALRLS
jgi:hypothetical protein